jgi:ABC-type molybdate transport system substrate-binding protein
LPAALQKTTTYTIGLGANARDTEAAKDFSRYILSDSAAAVFKAKGFSLP